MNEKLFVICYKQRRRRRESFFLVLEAKPYISSEGRTRGGLKVAGGREEASNAPTSLRRFPAMNSACRVGLGGHCACAPSPTPSEFLPRSAARLFRPSLATQILRGWLHSRFFKDFPPSKESSFTNTSKTDKTLENPCALSRSRSGRCRVPPEPGGNSVVSTL